MFLLQHLLVQSVCTLLYFVTALFLHYLFINFKKGLMYDFEINFNQDIHVL